MSDKRGGYTEADILGVIDERDAAEEALSQAYYTVIGESPEWSSTFGYAEANEAIGDACGLLRDEIQQLRAQLSAIRAIRAILSDYDADPMPVFVEELVAKLKEALNG
jgi:hypothetical protein